MNTARSIHDADPAANDMYLNSDYGTNQAPHATDFAQAQGRPQESSPLSATMPNDGQSGAFAEEVEVNRIEESTTAEGVSAVNRSSSTATTAVHASAPSRSNTLKKKSSMRKADSVKRSASRKSLRAANHAEFSGVHDKKEYNSAFYTPIPTHGAPTEILAGRFQAWRQLLKSLITYFREIQAAYEARAKATHKVQSAIANIVHPAVFMDKDGLADATRILDDYHNRSVQEANKSREIEDDVIRALTGLRSDLGQKIKEIKSLSGDFKNSVDKEKDNTKREVERLQDALQHADRESGGAVGKNDPYVVRLAVEKSVERQLDEENYLHRAYLNLESSGRELEAIVVGEIQKAYNAIAGILKREGDEALHTVEALRTGPISMPKDSEWMTFVQHDSNFVDPRLPLRRTADIDYPGKYDPAASEIRAGMLERKSKYLKSYTPGWYVLSPTHLHEFKSPDKVSSQMPVMSLCLSDQKLGSRSETGSSSNKFMVKGRQSGNMHKGHNWVFRAESYDTMVAWYEDMRILTEKTGAEKAAFVRKHARSVSATSRRPSLSSDGFEEDEADDVPYSADAANLHSDSPEQGLRPARPSPGGRFPSDMQIPRARGYSEAKSSTSSPADAPIVANVVALPGGLVAADHVEYGRSGVDPYRLDGVDDSLRTNSGDARDASAVAPADDLSRTPVQQSPLQQTLDPTSGAYPATLHPEPAIVTTTDNTSIYGDWMTSPSTARARAATLDSYRTPPATNIPQQQAAIKAHYPTDTVYRPSPRPSSAGRSSPAPIANMSARRGIDSVIAPAPAPAPAPTANSELGGLESTGARETGNFLPTVVRHSTAMSISKLHVPGEFPRV